MLLKKIHFEMDEAAITHVAEALEDQGILWHEGWEVLYGAKWALMGIAANVKVAKVIAEILAEESLEVEVVG